MVKAYVEKLSELIERVAPVGSSDVRLEVKHFFAGAAAYANGKVCITLTPTGLALKLPVEFRDKLVQELGAKPLRYFPKSPIKKEYALLSPGMVSDSNSIRPWMTRSIEYAAALSG